MILRPPLLVALLACPLAGLGLRSPSPDAPQRCDACEEWNTPAAPFKLYGGTYYVGTAGLSSLLITTPEGHVLLDGALPQSAPLIKDNIRRLGFKVEDVKWILTSHAHFDHVGGIAALARDTGARVGASAHAAQTLRDGRLAPDDPQAAYGREMNFPPVKEVSVIGDGQAVSLGGLTVTAHATPGHTPGGTTWTWTSCEGERCLNLVYGDSLNPVSAPGFRFSAAGGAPSTEQLLRQSIARVEALPCDILIAVHPGFSSTFEKQEARSAGGPDPFIDPTSCAVYAADARARLEKRLAEEAAAP